MPAPPNKRATVMRSPALQEHRATTVTPKGLTAAYEDIKGAVAEAIKRGSRRPSLQPKSSNQHR
jgi:hypothetical protein